MTMAEPSLHTELIRPPYNFTGRTSTSCATTRWLAAKPHFESTMTISLEETAAMKKLLK
jgi:hypothetical protein